MEFDIEVHCAPYFYDACNVSSMVFYYRHSCAGYDGRLYAFYTFNGKRRLLIIDTGSVFSNLSLFAFVRIFNSGFYCNDDRVHAPCPAWNSNLAGNIILLSLHAAPYDRQGSGVIRRNKGKLYYDNPGCIRRSDSGSYLVPGYFCCRKCCFYWISFYPAFGYDLSPLGL